MTPLSSFLFGFGLALGFALVAGVCIGWKHSQQARYDGYKDGEAAARSQVRRELAARAAQTINPVFTK